MINKISEDPPTASIYGDATDTGWGVNFQDRNTVGNWSLEEKYYHINVKEMLPLYFVLKCFAKDFSNLKLKIHIDNNAVVSILQNSTSAYSQFM